MRYDDQSALFRLILQTECYLFVWWKMNFDGFATVFKDTPYFLTGMRASKLRESIFEMDSNVRLNDLRYGVEQKKYKAEFVKPFLEERASGIWICAGETLEDRKGV